MLNVSSIDAFIVKFEFRFIIWSFIKLCCSWISKYFL